MPQSRKRKTRRGGPSARVTYSAPKKSTASLRIIAIGIVVALGIGLVIYLFAGRLKPLPGEQNTTATGLKYVDEVVGTGDSPKRGRMVSVHYTGTLENGTKFDSSVDRGQPYDFRLGVDPVIKGWEECLLTMKVGGKRQVIIPPELGYGATGRPPKIPPNATLLFEIELLGVK